MSIEEQLLIEMKKALMKRETPIAAAVVKNGKIIGLAHNLVEETKDVMAHAEILAIKQAITKTGDWRLEDCELYSVLEPCQMCKEVIGRSRIKKVYYYVAKTPKTIFKTEFVNKETIESLEMTKTITDFFQNLRIEKL